MALLRYRIWSARIDCRDHAGGNSSPSLYVQWVLFSDYKLYYDRISYVNLTKQIILLAECGEWRYMGFCWTGSCRGFGTIIRVLLIRCIKTVRCFLDEYCFLNGGFDNHV